MCCSWKPLLYLLIKYNLLFYLDLLDEMVLFLYKPTLMKLEFSISDVALHFPLPLLVSLWLIPHFRRRLLINPEEHPMLIAEPSTNTAQQREKYALMLCMYTVSITILMSHRTTKLVSYLLSWSWLFHTYQFYYKDLKLLFLFVSKNFFCK